MTFDRSSALKYLLSLESCIYTVRDDFRFMRRLHVDIGHIYQLFGKFNLAINYYNLAITHNDPESSFIAHSSLCLLSILENANPFLEPTLPSLPYQPLPAATISLDQINSYVSSYGNFGVIRCEVLYALRSLYYLYSSYIIKTK